MCIVPFGIRFFVLFGLDLVCHLKLDDVRSCVPFGIRSCEILLVIWN